MKKKLIIGLVISALFITYSARVYYVNATSVKVEKVVYEIGQTAKYKDFSYTLKSTKILNVDELNEEFKLNVRNDLYDVKYIVSEIEMEYTGDKDSAQCRLFNCSFQSGAWHNGESADVFFQLNANSMKLEKDKKYTLYTAGGLCKIMFTDDDWEKVNNMKFELVLATYPEEIVLKCN